MWRNLSHRKLDKVLEEINFKSILPTVTCGILVWGNCRSEIMDTLDPVHERAAWLILQQGHPQNQIGYQSLTFSKDAVSLFTRDVFQARVGCKPLGFLVKSDTTNVDRLPWLGVADDLWSKCIRCSFFSPFSEKSKNAWSQVTVLCTSRIVLPLVIGHHWSN